MVQNASVYLQRIKKYLNGVLGTSYLKSYKNLNLSLINRSANQKPKVLDPDQN